MDQHFQRLPILAAARFDEVTYVEQNFSQHVTLLCQGKPNNIPKLAEIIENHVSSVFLWVKLIVDILVEGAENGDDINNLWRKQTFFVTSRFIPDIVKKFDERVSLEIRAKNGDIEVYLDRNMGQLSAFDE